MTSTATSAAPAPAGQQSGSGDSPFQTLLASASQNSSSADNSSAVPAASAANQQDQSSEQDASGENNPQATSADATNSTNSTQATSTSTSSTSNSSSNTSATQPVSNALLAELPQGLLQGIALRFGVASSTAQGTTSADGKTTSTTTTDSGTHPTGKHDKAGNTNVPAITLPGNELMMTPIVVPVHLVDAKTSAGSGTGNGNGTSAQASTAALSALEAAAAGHGLLEANAQAAKAVADQAKAGEADAGKIEAADAAQVAAAQTSGAMAVNAETSQHVFTMPLNLQQAGAQISNDNAAIGKAAGKDTATVTKGSSVISSANASASSSATQASAGASNGASGSASNGSSQSGSGQSGQHSQIDPSLVTAVTTKPGDSGPAQIPPSFSHSISPNTATTQSSTDGTAAARSGSAAAELTATHVDGGDAVPVSGINTAKVLQSMSETEMRVGMHSAEFGDISIRTTISQQQMTAQISLDHGDLGQAISSHVSTVQSKLSDEYGLHAHIEVSQQSASFSGDSRQSSPQDQKAYKSFAQITGIEPVAGDNEISIASLPAMSMGDSYRLDIQA